MINTNCSCSGFRNFRNLLIFLRNSAKNLPYANLEYFINIHIQCKESRQSFVIFLKRFYKIWVKKFQILQTKFCIAKSSMYFIAFFPYRDIILLINSWLWPPWKYPTSASEYILFCVLKIWSSEDQPKKRHKNKIGDVSL